MKQRCLISSLKDYIKGSNLLLYSKYLNFRSSVNFMARRHKSLTEHIQRVDSIANYKQFRRIIMTVKNNPSVTLSPVYMYGSESLRHYGYYQEVLKFADLDESMFPYLLFEHGIRFFDRAWQVSSQYPGTTVAYACQGPERISEIYSEDPWKPVFVLGPYIHYASEYYDPEKTAQIKAKWGRVLLVFPSHTCEADARRCCTEPLFDTVYKKYANGFQTILVCSYWDDVDTPVLKKFEANGAKLVSAGFRSDPNFIRRLKTIILLSDAVVADDIGTNIGYCLYLRKPVYLECVGSRFPEDAGYTRNVKRFQRAFSSPNLEFTPEQLQQQQDIYRSVWGGQRYLRTKEELRAIFHVLEEMCQATRYNTRKMPDFIRCNGSLHSQNLGYRLLAEAVSPSAWN